MWNPSIQTHRLHYLEKKILRFLEKKKFQKFVEDALLHGDEVTSISLYDVYQNSASKMPIICGFTDYDIDPLIEIETLADEMGLEDVIKCLPVTKKLVRNIVGILELTYF